MPAVKDRSEPKTRERSRRQALPLPTHYPKSTDDRSGLSRRDMIRIGGALVMGGGIATAMSQWTRHEKGRRSEVFIAKARDYDVDLARLIHDGLTALEVKPTEFAGKSVLLKPNLVEATLGNTHVNTNPALVVAAAEVSAKHDLAHMAVVARRRRGELLGGDEGESLVTEADNWWRNEGGVDPDRLTQFVAPGFSRPK